MTDWCYKFLDLPHVPQELIDIAYNNINEQIIIKNNQNKDWEWKSKEKFVVNGLEKQNVAFIQYDLDPLVISWMRDNIISEGFTDIRISKSTAGDGKLPHTDNTRDYVLIYMLECGGFKPETVFYKEKSCNLYRERGVRIIDYDCVEEIDRVYIPPNHWCLLNTRIIHGVENITDYRISFQIGTNNYKNIKGQ